MALIQPFHGKSDSDERGQMRVKRLV